MRSSWIALLSSMLMTGVAASCGIFPEERYVIDQSIHDNDNSSLVLIPVDCPTEDDDECTYEFELRGKNGF